MGRRVAKAGGRGRSRTAELGEREAGARGTVRRLLQGQDEAAPIPEIYPSLEMLHVQKEELQRNCREGIKALMTQELWENRGQKKTISFMYEGVAPSEAAFYSLFRRHHPNGPCVYRATDIELEVLESILAEKISKQIGDETLYLQRKTTKLSWDSRSKRFSLRGSFGI